MSPLRATDALLAHLAILPDRIPLPRIERVWIFPPKEIGAVESGLVVLALLPHEPAEATRREVVTVRYEADRRGKSAAPTLLVTSQGLAPAERIPRVIEGVVARGGDVDDPLEAAIDGDPERWTSLMDSLTSRPVDQRKGE